MKIVKTLGLVLLGMGTLCAQNAQLPARLSAEGPQSKSTKGISRRTGTTENIIWSEDFASGIPSSWSQSGTPSTALWEYRGPNTTPSDTVGSRGAFRASLGPIASQSRANGFIIFDSDFLDNGGSNTNLGGGSVPAPHIGRLFTDTINLSTKANVELNFSSFASTFFGAFYIAMSTDAGQTYLDTVRVHPNLAVNASTANFVRENLNLSQQIGGQSQVVLQFIFDGTPGNVNGNGYYFWMIDDIELRETNPRSMDFTVFNGAPPQDIIYDPLNGGDHPKYGTMHANQRVPIQGDANVFNNGTDTLTNVALSIEVLDRNNLQLVHTVTGTGCSSLAPGDTCDFSNLVTNTWTPPAAAADYLLVYKVKSDSLSQSNALVSADTFRLSVSDSLYALHGGIVNNFVGTNSAIPEMIAMGVMMSLENEDPDSVGSGLVFLDGTFINLSGLTDSTADISISIFDTNGIAFNTGFPPGTQPLFTKVFSLDGSMPGTNAYFPFDTAGPISFNTGTYYLLVEFFPNATNGVIRLANQANPNQPQFASIMQLADGNWFSGFTSNVYEAPHITLKVGNAPGACYTSVQETLLSCDGTPVTTSQGNFTYTSSGVYSDTIFGLTCDTVVISNVIIQTATIDSLFPVRCNSYLSPSGQLYTQSGVYNDVVTNPTGCDSLFYIDLTIRQTFDPDSMVVRSCVQYQGPSGTVYTQSGQYLDTLVNTNTCDSVFFIDLIIDNYVQDTLNFSTCDFEYTSPSGQVFTQSGVYNDTILSSDPLACDTLLNLNLQLNPIDTGVSYVADSANAIAQEPNADSYQWIDCNTGQPIAGAQSRSFGAASNDGNYAVVVQKGNCTDTSACIFLKALSLAESLEGQLNLFPNPNEGDFTLSYPNGLHQVQLEIVNAAGQVVWQQRESYLLEKRFQLNLTKGWYMLKIEANEGKTQRSLIVK